MQNININSKHVGNEDIFVGISCSKLKENVKEAFERGASLVFSEKKIHKDVIVVDDSRLLASRLARFRYNRQPEMCVAVTGTNGKSSVSHFLKQIWNMLGKKSANIGTLGLFIDDDIVKIDGIETYGLTTPDPITFHKIMELLDDMNVSNCVFEASSHALDQKRIHSVSLEAAGFTSLASDHLDYHKTRKSYLRAKLKLFKDVLNPSKPAIISRDSRDIYDEVLKYNKNIVSFGISKDNFIRATNIRSLPNRINFDLICGNVKFENVEINLSGEFQVMNILCAVSLAVSTKFDIEEIVQILPKIKSLEGRMEHIADYKGGNIYVDFAHTTEAFRNSLTSFKSICNGRLICVFGCGGDRDKSKRSEIGKIADDIADIVIVTDDNPRTEHPSKIRKEIMKGCKKAIEIGDRKEAIRHAIEMMTSGDSVVVLGKGHEKIQILHDKTIDFSDREEILKIVTLG
jgi:UDP-N-acetylmuramoyl-L-alanyl-D-glutamate--2,6-diaminopimelate ligase